MAIEQAATLWLALASAGCVGNLWELPSHADGGAPAEDLLACAPGAMPQNVHFQPDIEMDLERLGCAAAVCHGGTKAPFLKDGNVDGNYANFSALAKMGAMSPILAHLLRDAVPPHGGGVLFSSTCDPMYAKWLAWIEAGAPR
jgi:hypothetical protein